MSNQNLVSYLRQTPYNTNPAVAGTNWGGPKTVVFEMTELGANNFSLQTLADSFKQTSADTPYPIVCKNMSRAKLAAALRNGSVLNSILKITYCEPDATGEGEDINFVAEISGSGMIYMSMWDDIETLLDVAPSERKEVERICLMFSVMGETLALEWCENGDFVEMSM